MRAMMAVGTLIVLTGTQALAAEKYVSDPVVNQALHGVENAWNNSYGGDGADVTGTYPNISETATSSTGTTTVTLKVTDVGFEIDFGELQFEALDPIQERKCAFTAYVNEVEASGEGEVKVDAPANDYKYDCEVTMGIKNFTVTGYITISDTGAVSFSSLVVNISQSNYYFNFPCSSDAMYIPELDEETSGALPSSYRNLLVKDLRLPTSQFSTVSKSRTLQNMKKDIRELADQ